MTRCFRAFAEVGDRTSAAHAKFVLAASAADVLIRGFCLLHLIDSLSQSLRTDRHGTASPIERDLEVLHGNADSRSERKAINRTGLAQALLYGAKSSRIPVTDFSREKKK